MTEWVETFKAVGLPVLATAVLALVVRELFGKYLWPMVTKRLEDADKRLEESAKRFEEQGKLFTESLKNEREICAKRFDEQGRLFAEAMRTSGVFAAESHKEITAKLQEISRNIKSK